MGYFWLGIVIFLSMIEAATVDVVTIWYVVSGVVTIVLSFFVDNFILQLALFTILGTILLFTTRPLVKKALKSKNIKTNFDRVIGMEGIVTEDITLTSIGEVKVDGKRWSAISEEELKKGTPVIILSIDGVKLKVKKVEN